jgi:Uma2 family endonuclease
MSTSTLIQTDPPRPARETLPTMYDLPSEEIGDPGMPDEYHVRQATLLDETFSPPNHSPDEVFSAVDMNLYYDEQNTDRYIRPDWFGVVGVPSLYQERDSRLSYVVWDEARAPLIVVELLSPRTQQHDLGLTPHDEDGKPTKWEIYEQYLRVPYYVVFGRRAKKMRAFRLKGRRYVEVLSRGGRLWIAEAKLGLGLWQGRYHKFDRLWLRWFDAQGNCIPTPAELAEQERQRAEAERQRAKQERQRAKAERQRAEAAQAEKELIEQRVERMAQLLRQLGQDPDQI